MKPRRRLGRKKNKTHSWYFVWPFFSIMTTRQNLIFRRTTFPGRSEQTRRIFTLSTRFSHCAFFKFKRLLFDFDIVSLKPIALELLWLLVAQKSLACGRAALTLGQRLPYCGPMTFLPFRAYSPRPPTVLAGAQSCCGLVSFSCSQLHGRN